MVSMRSLTAALVGACVAVSSFRAAEGIKACSECAASTTCIVEDTNTKLNAGSTQLALRICNFSATTPYTVALSLKAPLACDPKGALVPKVKALKASGACANGAECAVVAELEYPIDWAIVMRNGADAQALIATFSNGGSTDAVTVAVSQDIAGAAMQTSDAAKVAATPISVCATAVTVTAQRLSRVDGCSTADICRGKATDTTCTVPVKTSLPITGVTCDGSNCSGKLALAGAVTCDAATSSSDATALLVGVRVGATPLTNFAAVGALAAPTLSSIAVVSDLAVGRAAFSIATDTQCPAAGVVVSIATASKNSKAPTVANVNTTNGLVAVTLAAPLDSALSGAMLQVTLTQCGVASKAFETVVSDSDSPDVGDLTALNSTSNNGTLSRNSSAESTQETNVPTGLSGGMIVGITVGVVAFLGFVVECMLHKRRQGPPMAHAAPSSDATPMPPHNTM